MTMGAIFKVRFDEVWQGDKSKDAEHAIKRVRADRRKCRVPAIDDDGNLVKGKWNRVVDITVVSVECLTSVDIP